MRAPNTAMTIDSSRIIRRICLREAPIARIRPISRVRSTTESARVLTTPRIAMMIARPSRP